MTNIPRIALITGGGSGLGRAAALALAENGYAVAVGDINPQGAQDCARTITQASGRAIALTLDVTDDASVEQAFQTIENTLGPVTALVNSAGVLFVAPLLDYPMKEWERTLAVNVSGSFRCAQRAAQGMVQRGHGRIVNLASISGVRAGLGRAAYGTSKAAVIGLTRQLAIELGQHGITANAIAPGPVSTAMTQEAYTPETWTSLKVSIPAGRIGTVEDIADAIVFLCSDGASYVNGQTLAVDGGYLASGINNIGPASR